LDFPAPGPRSAPGARSEAPEAVMRAITAGAASFSEPLLRPNPHGVSRHLALVRGFNVLLVDDNHHHRIPLLRALRHQGHSVLHAADGASGETLCRASQLEIDALIACADMKRMCGFELARRVARVRPEVRVLLMGRHLGPEEAHRAYERGYAVIEEPFTPEQLCHRLTGLLGSPRNDTGAEPRLVAGDRLIPREDQVLAIGSRKKNAPPKGIEPWNRARAATSPKAGRRSSKRVCPS
jgi:CheY-like chemotaxis protein